MTKLNAIRIFVLMLMVFVYGTAASQDPRKVTIETLPASDSKVDILSATAFGISLAGALEASGSVAAEPIGIYKPTFDILSAAFRHQIQIWRELKASEDPGSECMNQLISIDDAGYLNEYLWLLHSGTFKGNSPETLKLESFSNWFKKNLTGHVSRIEARLRLHE